MKCVMCGHKETEKTTGNYPLIALPGTVLVNLEIDTCPNCGERYTSIPRLEALMHTLAAMVIRQESRLTGDEIRFLRGFLDLKQTELAATLGIDPTTLSRAENGDTIGQQTDRLLRMIVAYDIRVEGYSELLAGVAVTPPVEWRAKIVFKGDRWEPAA